MSSVYCQVCGMVGDAAKIKQVCCVEEKPNEELSVESCSKRCFLLEKFGTSLSSWSDYDWWHEDFDHETSDIEDFRVLRTFRAKQYENQTKSREKRDLLNELRGEFIKYQNQKLRDYEKQARNLQIKSGMYVTSKCEIQTLLDKRSETYERTRAGFKQQMEKADLVIENAAIALNISLDTFQDNKQTESLETYAESRVRLKQLVEQELPKFKLFNAEKLSKPMVSMMETLDDYKDQMPQGAYLAMCNEMKNIWESAE